jgi:putative hydrolase of the HAD superfamily
VNEEWLTFLKGLRAEGVFVGLLSNMVPAWDEHWRRMVPPQDVFDHVVLSFEAGCRKPMPEIFRLAEKACGIPASASVLVDDVAGNCAGARAAGWHAVEFATAAQAITQVTALLDDQRRPGSGTRTGDPSRTSAPSLPSLPSLLETKTS